MNALIRDDEFRFLLSFVSFDLHNPSRGGKIPPPPPPRNYAVPGETSRRSSSINKRNENATGISLIIRLFSLGKSLRPVDE